jgi:hypothetical protein
MARGCARNLSYKLRSYCDVFCKSSHYVKSTITGSSNQYFSSRWIIIKHYYLNVPYVLRENGKWLLDEYFFSRLDYVSNWRWDNTLYFSLVWEAIIVSGAGVTMENSGIASREFFQPLRLLCKESLDAVTDYCNMRGNLVPPSVGLKVSHQYFLSWGLSAKLGL